ncbi:uncharacterized protein LOC109400918 [Aedes albopictus]|uniref:Secreted protein n=1 Tax=Aedes albopictus TaxID=7160 RepID=A0ABM1XXI7_AEDAL|nr:uncharacterized protein LOC109400918 [Aedes albopictus]
MGVSVHNVSLDSVFSSLGRNQFLRCYTCSQYSPFLIYLGYNEKAVQFCREAKDIQLFCPICSPNPVLYKHLHPGESLFRADSILNDQRLLNLLADYVSEDDPYSTEDRIIITENTQLCSPYKAVAKRMAPKSHKLKLLMNLFPEAHRMRNEHYVDREDLCESMKRKYHDVCVSYMDISEAGGSQLIDNFDILIDKTPMVIGQRHQSRVPAVPAVMVTEPSPLPEPEPVLLSDSDREIRAVGSDDESEIGSVASGGSGTHFLISGSDITVVSEVQISSEEPAGNWDIHPSSQSQSQHLSRRSSQIVLAEGQSSSTSQSVDISSQSVIGGGKQSELSYGSDSSDSCVIDFPSAPRAPPRRRPPSADDGQQPGPSNVKRRRVSPRGNRPMNPSPEEFQRNPHAGGRVPRVDGG